MNRTHILASGAALLASAGLAVPVALAANQGPKVSVRIEGLKKTLLPADHAQSAPRCRSSATPAPLIPGPAH